MKINHIAKGLSLAALALTLGSCTSGFEEINRPGGNLDKGTLQRDNYSSSSSCRTVPSLSRRTGSRRTSTSSGTI